MTAEPPSLLLNHSPRIYFQGAVRVLRCHPISRHDGPLSVRRAYSPDEIRGLAENAGIPRPRIQRYPRLGRLLAVW